MPDPVTVLPVDCLAAAELIETYWSGADANMMKLARSYRASHSQGVFVRAMRDHRLASEQAERALVIAWLRAAGQGAWDKWDDELTREMLNEAADAIEAMAHRNIPLA